MRQNNAPMLLEIDSRAASKAYRAFLSWALEAAIRVCFGPDTFLAIDAPGRRGFLADEVYFVTIWIDIGAADFETELHTHLGTTERTAGCIEKDHTDERQPGRRLALVMAHGHSLAEVRHLL